MEYSRGNILSLMIKEILFDKQSDAPSVGLRMACFFPASETV